MLVFKDRLIQVLCNSPLHETEVAVIELYTTKPSFDGAIALTDLVHFAGLINLRTGDIFVREQSESCIELWLHNPDRYNRHDFDEDPTPVDISIDRVMRNGVQKTEAGG